MRKIVLFCSILLLGNLVVLGQTKEITGKITNEKGDPVPFASIVLRGTKSGVTSDANGAFALKAKKGDVFEVTTVGYTNTNFKVHDANSYSITLTRSASADMTEVVVTGYGIKRQAKSLGVATAKVSSNEINRAGVTNVVSGLTAKVSGLQINTVNNGVNPDTRITLRGNRHLLATNQALVILDGVPTSATYLNSINPRDIDNVQVLKGASASAIYGNDASNGVLIVTTKKGNGRPVVNFSNTTTFEEISYLPKLQSRFGAGSGETIANNVGGTVPNYIFWIGPDRNTDPYTSYENQNYGPEFNGQMVILGGVLADGSYQTVPYSAIKNQKKKFFDIGQTVQNDISYSVGDEKSNFYISAQDVNTKGVTPHDKNRRTGLRIAGGRTTGIFHAEYTLGYSQTNTNVSGGEFFQGRPVYWNVLNTPANVDFSLYKDIENNKFANNNGYYNAYYPNPYWQTIHSRNITKNDDILGSATISLKPAEWVEVLYRVGATSKTWQNNYYRDEVTFNSYMVTDPWGAGHMANGKPVFPGNAGDAMYNTLTLTGDFLATFNKKFNDITTKLILGNAMYNYKYRYVGVSASSTVIPDFYNVSNRTGEPGAGESNIARTSMGIFGDFSLGYKDWLFFHGSLRNDWDSRLQKANRSFLYPAADVSIVLSEIVPAIQNSSLISFAKVRGGWSKTGQVALNNFYATLPAYGSGAGFPFGNTVGYLQSSTLSNPNLKPEITKELELGFELGFLRDRIHFEATAYKTNTIDQTIPAGISSATGYTGAYINGGELEGKGIEFDLKMAPVVNLGGFTWNTSINYSYLTSKLLSLIPGIDEILIDDVSYGIVGQQFPSLKVSDVIRDPQGRIIVDAVTGYPKKATATVNIGHGNPNHMLGLVNTFMFKGLSLNIVADYRSGNKIYNAVGNALDFTGTSWHSAQNGRQPFVIPNSVILSSDGKYIENTDVVVRNASRDFWVNSDYHNVGSTYVTSAAFWKIREISISYDLPLKKWMNQNVLKSAQASLVGRNLFMFRPVTNTYTDPEFNTRSGANNAVGYTTEDQTPATRIYGFQLKLTF